MYVEARAQLSGHSVETASVIHDARGRPSVLVQLTQSGGERLGRITSAYAPNGELNEGNNIGRQLAIIFDGKVYSAPVIREPVTGGSVHISGDLSEEEVLCMAAILNAGAIPLPIRILE